jgi:hypothetical protein
MQPMQHTVPITAPLPTYPQIEKFSRDTTLLCKKMSVAQRFFIFGMCVLIPSVIIVGFQAIQKQVSPTATFLLITSIVLLIIASCCRGRK